MKRDGIGFVEISRNGLIPSVSLMTPNKDPVDVAHQAHYEALDPQPIKLIEAWLTSEAFREVDPFSGYMWAATIKYLARYPLKNGVEDLRKARDYLDMLIEHSEGKKVTR